MDEDEILQEENTIEEPEALETQSEPVIYTGPNIAAFALMRFQVFRGGLPPYVSRAVEKIPEIAELIVPVRELEEMRKKISRPGTNESRLFDTVQKEAEKFNTEYRKKMRKERKR